MAHKRKEWSGLASGFKANNLVFLDESGCNTDMTRRYAYSLGGSRAVDSAPLTKPKSTTILSSIQLDGTLRYTTFSGGTTVEKFKKYLANDLLPYLNSDSVLIMDNMRSHHAKAVKALLRKFKARSEDRLSDATRDAFRAVTASDCLGWFRSCGYML